jgi:pimeloyl-ACP methyl ester carboxylesterase
MPQTESHGARIHYDIEGQGPPVVFVHGFSGSRNSWRGYGFVEPLKTEYQLILMDARGHGESSKPHHPDAYDYRLMVDDVIAVMDDLDLPTASYVGFSMGGTIGFGLAKHYPHRVRSLIIGGQTPFNRTDPGKPSPLLDLYERAVEQGPELIVDTFRTWFGPDTPEADERIRSSDIRAAAAQLRGMREHRPDFGDDLAAMTITILAL